VAATQFVTTGDSRLTNDRNPLPGSINYIQNTPNFQQFAEFDVGGSGRIRGDLTVDGILTAQLPSTSPNYVQNRTSQQSLTNFNISGNGTVGGTLNGNVVNATTQYNIGGQRVFRAAATNLFAGINAGTANTTGTNNTFVGASAGASNSTGLDNIFIGTDAGPSNTTGLSNIFIGVAAGFENTTGDSNISVGENAGTTNTTGNSNVFVGTAAGYGNTAGQGNTFVGHEAGASNTIGINNTIIGIQADVAGNLSYATAIGAGAVASNSNSIVLGRATGADEVRLPGAVIIDGSLVVHTLGSAGSTQICLNTADRLAPCSSSLRYKTNVELFLGGLDIVRRLRPISFNWKDGGMNDIGFGAEEVDRIEPRLTIRNKQGEIEGVKYGQLTTVLVNAVKEQQTQIESQQKRLLQQQSVIDGLKRHVCQADPHAEVCLQGENK
jgi:hypothetical protein